ncbi:hypothetical protein N3K66_007207 [Trichothecium roseum]|uniref:Uncharacterized protein n=1 Tax=Trichothecium roseum TaxID=47278 RepID=A0ACC0UTC8_9HYPO|nr:hypothetical protein N3K66_007207 [Trichothecium roseum]
MTSTHSTISPAILYWGTPVLLITSENEDGSDNVCAISSMFCLGRRCVLGFSLDSKTPGNIMRAGECVVNMPDEGMIRHVNALSWTTGVEEPSAAKLAGGYRFVGDKWAHAGLTPQPSDLVRPASVAECPVQMECRLAAVHGLMEDERGATGDGGRAGILVALEMDVVRVRVAHGLRMAGHANRVDPDRWRPMIMSFQHLYGLAPGKLGESALARIDEEHYRPLAADAPGSSANDDDERENQARGG